MTKKASPLPTLHKTPELVSKDTAEGLGARKTEEEFSTSRCKFGDGGAGTNKVEL